MSVDFYKKAFLILVFALFGLQLSAQRNQVSGTVYDNDQSTPFLGATVIVKGTSVGVTTDVNGKYTISAKPDDVLIFQYLGYDSQEVPVSNQTVINLVMRSSSQAIDEVVVTALGISREQKSLGYAVTKIEGDDMVKTGSGNWLDGLSGKVPGLKFDQAGTGPMGSMRVTLRGDNSLNYGNNEVLVVVDGIPVSSGGTSTSSGSNYANSDAPVDFGNGLSDLNPDDIETINVLKGAAATALYGSRAGNGALIITTKAGRKERGIGVSFSSTTSVERVMRWPDFQTEYGGGSDMGVGMYSFWNVPADQSFTGSSVSRNQSRYAFGEKFDSNKLRYQYNSFNFDFDNPEYTPLPWEYKDDWFKGMFVTGVTTKNIISVDGNNGEGSSMRFSITDVRSKWVLPNTPNTSQTYALKATHKLNKFITLNASVNYLRRDSDNVPYSGYGSKNPVYSLIWSTPNHSIEDGFKADYFEGRFTDRQVRENSALYYQSENSYNPYFTLYEEVNKVDRDRVYGNVNVSIDIIKGLVLDLKGGMDMNNEFRTQQAPKYSGSTPGGFYREQTIRGYEITTSFLLRYNTGFLNDRLQLAAGLSGERWNLQRASTSLRVPRLGSDNVFKLTNLAEGYPLESSGSRSWKRINSVLGYVNLSWDNYLYVDITGRNDWSSTLHDKYNSYFYPSVSMSFLIDEAFNIKDRANWVDMMKVRASWANVGLDTDPYRIVESMVNTSYPGGFRMPRSKTSQDIRPENVESYEVGLEMSFLKGRINFDATYYFSSITDQIVSVDKDAWTGYRTQTVNAGEITNSGIELSASFIPVRTRNFTWSMSANWSKNWNKLVSMYDGWNANSPLQTPMGTTIGNRVYIYSFVGEEMHWIYGKDYVTAPEGATYTDANGKTVDASGMKIIGSTGLPSLTSSADQRIAKVNPDWYAGMSHTFTYKNLSLGMNFSAQWGGHTYSTTNFALAYQGKTKSTLPGRYAGMVIEGVNEIKDSNGNVTGYQKNATVTENIQTYYNAVKFVRDNVRENTFDTSFLKLKSLTLDYTFPSALIRKTGFIEGASLGVFVTNVFCITKFPQFDPETGNFQGTNALRGIESGALPMTRSFGFNIKLSF